MMKRFLQSRTFRKLLRNRLAMGALAVIFVYFLAAAAVFLGAISTDETAARVGPKDSPGLIAGLTPEQRLENIEFYLETVETALGSSQPEAALRGIKLGKLRIANKSLEELRNIVDSCWETFDELIEYEEEVNNRPDLIARIDEIELKKSELFAPMSKFDSTMQVFYLSLGTDKIGSSIALRAIYSIKVAFQIGAVTALVSVGIGSFLGAAAGFFGSWVDHAVIWLYSTFSSIPNLVLLVVLVYAFNGSRFDGTLIPVYVAFCMTFWIGPCRVIRGETLKLKELEYVHAARAMGFPRIYILLRHIIPNTAHLMLVNFSLLFIGAIKSEVILSFLGLGVKKGPSWGRMISYSTEEITKGNFWQIGTATIFMVGLVLAFNILTDALQDILDPKHV